MKNMPTAQKEKKEGNILIRFWTYLKESREELKKVSWPTRKDTLKGTYTVLVFTLIVAVFLGVLDYFFNLGLEEFLTR
ncbi:preprotein translocase subunit SecE [Patescibacteria group bacterium]|nr:preprotein translocase subunit SecE [Patescibacteria group bacterium]MBU1673501.1 preprotein translocase subunit SecE [Patescibacteria group bacterium]MBU1963753.1 preprotein translocase subunit SecE [Patescibacteria group bacterium]